MVKCLLHNLELQAKKMGMKWLRLNNDQKMGSMKGYTIKSGDKRPTKKGAGMTAKGVAKYRRA